MRIDILWPRSSKMASCFDFRMRTSSFDLHRLTQRHKMAKLGRLFRSRSDSNVKSDSKGSPKNSPSVSPKGSPNNHKRRRFIRVVKNAESAGEEYENPHVIRRYTQKYVQDQWSQQKSSSFDEAKLPYQVEGHTILKRHSSGDSGSLTGGDQSPAQKHASFNEDVEVIEFDRKDKIIDDCPSYVEKLNVGEDDAISEMPEFCPYCVEQDRVKLDCPHSSDSEQSDTESSTQNKKKKQLLRKHLHLHQHQSDVAQHHVPGTKDHEDTDSSTAHELSLAHHDIREDSPDSDLSHRGVSPPQGGRESDSMISPKYSSIDIVRHDVLSSPISEDSTDLLIDKVANTHITTPAAEI